MLNLSTIVRPTLLLDREKCESNIAMMADKAKTTGVRLRPHFKTHQSKKVGDWFKQVGVKEITVSSLSMASYFSDDWKDITVAFPINTREWLDVNRLASKIKLNLTLVNQQSIHLLGSKLNNNVNYYIKIDVGYHRTGLRPENTKEIDLMLNANRSYPKLKFAGFIAHAGHSYNASGRDQVAHIHQESLQKMIKLKSKYELDYPNLQLSVGDTPTCSLMDSFYGMDEIRPGNFTFYDLTQARIGSCRIDQIAVALAVPIVAKHFDRNELIVYGGSAHLSKDYLSVNGCKTFGQVVELSSAGWSEPVEGVYVSKLSQEHGTIKCTPEYFSSKQVGNLVGILPIHSCLTSILMRGYLTLSNEEIDHLCGQPVAAELKQSNSEFSTKHQMW